MKSERDRETVKSDGRNLKEDVNEGGGTIVQKAEVVGGECALDPGSWNRGVLTRGSQVSLKVRTEKARQKSWPHQPRNAHL